GGEGGGAAAVRGVFGEGDAVVEPGGGEDDFEPGAFFGGEAAGGGDDAADVRGVVGGVGRGVFAVEQALEEGLPAGEVGHLDGVGDVDADLVEAAELDGAGPG